MVLQLQLDSHKFISQVDDFSKICKEIKKDDFDWKRWDKIFAILATPLPKIITLTDIYAFELKPLLTDLQKTKLELETCALGFIASKPNCQLKDLDAGLKIFQRVCNNLLNGIRLKTDKNVTNIQVIPDKMSSEKKSST